MTSHLYTKLRNFAFPPGLQPSENHLFILFFSSVHRCKFLSWNKVFLPLQSEILLHKTRSCLYPCGGNCIGSEVKYRFFSGWSIIKLVFRMILPSLARRLAKGTSGGLTERQGPFSSDWRSNWTDHWLHSTPLRFRGCLLQLQCRMGWACGCGLYEAG